jgi:intein-encoded DNA endonuclease-like protein
MPWDIQVEEVEAYIKALKKKGFSPWTIQKRLTDQKKLFESYRDPKG